MRVLITGITGFVGSHLADYLLKIGNIEVYGLKRWRSPLDNIEHILDKIKLVNGDLRDFRSISTLLNDINPDKIFHLAAQSFVPTSFTAPMDTVEANVLGTVNLLEAVRYKKLDPIIHICSTSEVYGNVPKEEQPITEDTHFRPQNPYGYSKCGEDLAGYLYFKAYGMKTFITRAFSHTGPRRGDVFAASSFARQIARIEYDIQPPVIKVGNVDSVRTWMDVRDTVEVYWLLSEKRNFGEAYIVGGNTTKTIKEVLDTLISFSMKKNEIKIETDPTLFRPADITLQIPDNSKLQATIEGWKPKIPFEVTMRDLLDYWRYRIRRNLRAV